jgi:hypothetical protein
MDWRCGSSSRSLLCKCEALKSNRSPTKNKTKQNKKVDKILHTKHETQNFVKCHETHIVTWKFLLLFFNKHTFWFQAEENIYGYIKYK